MLDLLRSVQKKLSNLRNDVNILMKAEKEVRDHQVEHKDKYLCKKCIKKNRKFSVTALNVLGRVILPKSVH